MSSDLISCVKNAGKSFKEGKMLMKLPQTFIESNTNTWKLDELDSIIDDVGNCMAEHLHRSPVIDTDRLKHSLIHIIGKTIVTARAIIELSRCGYADGALGLARNLYEQFVFVTFFRTHKNDADFQNILEDYELSAHYQYWKKQEQMCKIFAPEQLPAIQKEIDDVVQKINHQKDNNGPKGDYYWAGKSSFAKLVEDIEDQNKELISILKDYYKEACFALHAGCLGNSMRVGIPKEYNEIVTDPTSDVSEPLYFSLMSLIGIVCAVFDELGIPIEPFKKRLNDLAGYYMEKIDEQVK